MTRASARDNAHWRQETPDRHTSDEDEGADIVLAHFLISPNLSEIMSCSSSTSSCIVDWVPPSSPGLGNSRPITPPPRDRSRRSAAHQSLRARQRLPEPARGPETRAEDAAMLREYGLLPSI
eukprot:CAMPEP_0206041322 /NCGR_PEP_ID=MMETSP1466-20131121/5908_1 /ASSEMBLY_ACC=CAM_ASM_001126 /TAXON_ID=44452 /ORGANISM="Pavlova gyrans, Strain CCMP608" /LENGTH=121 /DNA_ID=CAMNT_0053416017 /DNA_START=51 /DNA_END=416 /DNA_ORIENTATION=+